MHNIRSIPVMLAFDSATLSALTAFAWQLSLISSACLGAPSHWACSHGELKTGLVTCQLLSALLIRRCNLHKKGMDNEYFPHSVALFQIDIQFAQTVEPYSHAKTHCTHLHDLPAEQTHLQMQFLENFPLDSAIFMMEYCSDSNECNLIIHCYHFWNHGFVHVRNWLAHKVTKRMNIFADWLCTYLCSFVQWQH